MGGVACAIVALSINLFEWPGMPYERPPMVVNMAFVIGAALGVALAAVWWVGADVMHRLDRVENRFTQIDGRLARLEARIEEVHAGPPAETDTVRMQQPAMLRSDGRVYFGGMARSQVEALAETVTSAVTSKLEEKFTAVDERVEALDTLLATGAELRTAVGAENTPTHIKHWVSKEQRGPQTRDVRGRA